MLEYLIYMLLPVLVSSALLYRLIARFSLQRRLRNSAKFVAALTLLMYLGSEPAVCALKPWVFDCAKTLGFCPCGLPIEDLLFSFLVVLNVTMATLVFSHAEQNSRGFGGFFRYLLLNEKPKAGGKDSR